MVNGEALPAPEPILDPTQEEPGIENFGTEEENSQLDDDNYDPYQAYSPGVASGSKFQGPSPLDEEDAINAMQSETSSEDDEKEETESSTAAKTPKPKSKPTSVKPTSVKPPSAIKPMENPRRKRERTRAEEKKRIEKVELDALTTIASAAKASISGQSDRKEKNDSYDTFGIYVADKMRKLSEKLDEEEVEMLEFEITSSIATRFSMIKQMAAKSSTPAQLNHPNQHWPTFSSSTPASSNKQWPNMLFNQK